MKTGHDSVASGGGLGRGRQSSKLSTASIAAIVVSLVLIGSGLIFGGSWLWLRRSQFNQLASSWRKFFTRSNSNPASTGADVGSSQASLDKSRHVESAEELQENLHEQVLLKSLSKLYFSASDYLSFKSQSQFFLFGFLNWNWRQGSVPLNIHAKFRVHIW